jgi:hypothetical protein
MPQDPRISDAFLRVLDSVPKHVPAMDGQELATLLRDAYINGYLEGDTASDEKLLGMVSERLTNQLHKTR